MTCDRLNDNRRRYWNAVGDISGKRSQSELLNGYKQYLEYIKFIKIRSEKIKKLDFNELIDIAFLDGPHTYTAAKREFTFVDKFLVPGGFKPMSVSTLGNLAELSHSKSAHLREACGCG